MVTDTAVATVNDNGAAIMERVIVTGDLAKLSPQERVTYYMRTCESLGLNPLTKPFDYIVLNNKLTLYANRSAADQLRSIRGVSIIDVDINPAGDAFTVKVKGRDATGREDVDIGYVSTRGVTGEAIGNAMKKAVTQGKRRLTLSLVGLGWLDDTEIAQIPDAQPANVDPETGEIKPKPTLAERVQAKRAEIVQPSGLSREAFAAALKEHRIDVRYAVSVAEATFGKGTDLKALTDVQREQLLASLTEPQQAPDDAPQAEPEPLTGSAEPSAADELRDVAERVFGDDVVLVK